MPDENSTRPMRRALILPTRKAPGTAGRTGAVRATLEQKFKIGRGVLEWLLFALLSVARFAASGLVYYPQLDDYIQYYKYTALCTPAEAVIKYGMLAARPLSNAADVFVWAKFWPCLFAAVVIISLLYAASAIMFRRVFAALFPSLFEGGGTAFLLLYLLLPLNIEGTYWLSASTRVVCGLFWTSLSAMLFIRWLEGKRAGCAVLYALTQLLAMASYEQALTLVAAITALIAAVYYRRSGRRVLLALTLLSNGIIYWVFISQFRDTSPLYASAYGMVLPFSAHFWRVHLPHVLQQFTAAFVGGGVLILFKGALRGIVLVFREGKAVYFLVTLLCAGLTSALLLRPDKSRDRPLQTAGPAKLAGSLAAGVFLAAAPLLPHVIKENPWFSLRGTVSSLPGIALCVEALLANLLLRIGRRLGTGQALRRVAAGAGGLFVALCFFATASELDDYRLTYENDQAVMAAVAEVIDLEDARGRIALVGVLPCYLSDQNFFYHEHIHGVTESDWALSGALFAYSGGLLDPSARFVPLTGDAAQRLLLGETEGFDQIYIYADGKFVRADIN